MLEAQQICGINIIGVEEVLSLAIISDMNLHI